MGIVEDIVFKNARATFYLKSDRTSNNFQAGFIIIFGGYPRVMGCKPDPDHVDDPSR